MKKASQWALVLCLLGTLTACQPVKEKDVKASQITSFVLGSQETPAEEDWINLNDGEILQLKTALGQTQWEKSTVKLESTAEIQASLKDKDGQIYRLYHVSDALILQADGSKVLYQAPVTFTQVMSFMTPLKKAVEVRSMIELTYLREASAYPGITQIIDWTYATFELTVSQSTEIKGLMDFGTWNYLESKPPTEPIDDGAIILLPAGNQRLYFHSDGTQATLTYQGGSATVVSITYEIPMIVYASVLEKLKTMRVLAFPKASDQILNAVYTQATFNLNWADTIPDYLKNATTFDLTPAQSALAKPSLYPELWVRKDLDSATAFDDTYLTLTDTDGYVTTIGFINSETAAFARITKPGEASFIEWYVIPMNLTTVAMAFAPAWTAGSPNASLRGFSPVKLTMLKGPYTESPEEDHDLSTDLQASIKDLLQVESWRIYPYQVIIFALGYDYKFTDNQGHVIYISDYSTLNPELDMTTIRVVDLNPDGAKDLFYMAPRSIIQDLKTLIEPIYPRQ